MLAFPLCKGKSFRKVILFTENEDGMGNAKRIESGIWFMLE